MTLPMGDKPWMPMAAIKWLEAIIKPSWRIFEWGAGGSTLWFAQRAKAVYSIEGDLGWSVAVLDRAEEMGLENVDVRHVACVHDVGPFDEYARIIEDYPAMFDLILIDGCNGTRLGCARRAVTKVKPGGYIMLDNSGAAVHVAARDYLDGVYPMAGRWIDEVYAVTPAHAGTTENSVWRAT